MTAKVRGAAPALLATLVLLALWEAVGRAGWLGPAFPPMTSVLKIFARDESTSLLRESTASTAWSAVRGVVIGAGAGIACALTRELVELSRVGLDRFAATVHSVPGVVAAPLLTVALSRESAPAAMASLAAFFPAYVAATKAFAAASPLQHDVFTALGSSSWNRFRRLRSPMALPGLCEAMRLACPGAALGAVLGEWFGAPHGLGQVILSASQAFQIELMWAAAVLATLLALAGYLLFTVLQTLATRRFA